MFRVAVKGLLAHKLRLFMTAVSIALGVAFVAGTFVLTDSLNSSFSTAYTNQYAGVDVAVRADTSFADSEAAEQRQPVPAGLLETVRRVPGVARAEGSVSGFATMVDENGRTIGAGVRSRTGMSTSTTPGLDGAISYRSGRAPARAGEVAVDAASAEKGSLAVGDRIRVLFRGPPEEFTVVGVARFGKEDRLGSTTTALFDPATAQRVLGKSGRYDEIRVKAAPGVPAAELRDRITAALPAGVGAATGTAVADEATKLVKDGLSFVNVFLLVFAGIAVFVGSFIIWNTFTILVAQRSRELALLRAVGAKRRQVMRAVLSESLVVGLVASVLGLALGVGIARLLVLLLRRTADLDLPTPGAQLSARTVLVSLLVGTVVTLLASLAPARKATRVAPIEALRDAAPGAYRFSARRAVAGSVVLAAGLAALAAGLFAGSGAALVGLGAVLSFLGISTLLPLLSRVLTRILGAPLRRLAGMTGKLARDNALRNPKRTASTAAALMIGLALVASVSVVASSLKESIGSDIDRTGRADLVVQRVGGQGVGLGPDVARSVRGTPGITAVSEIAAGRGKVDGTLGYLSAVDPATISTVLDLGVTTGSVAGLGADGVLVHTDTAEAKGWAVGTPVQVEWPQTGTTTVRVAGTFAEKGTVGSDYLVSLATYDRNVSGRLDSLVLLKAAPGSDLDTVQGSVVSTLRPYADAEVLTADEFTASISGQVDRFLTFVTALLLLAVVIALIGIVNTLALSVFERTREIGLLRAVGMSRRQVRGMIRWEAVIIALIGALTGAVVGVGLGVALVEAMEDQGLSVLAIPGTRLGVSVLAAAVAGVLAALGPARRAAKVDVLRAVVSD